MELSVIIPVYRETACILPTLTHLLSLDLGPDSEVIVVDGEPDRTTLRFLETSALFQQFSGPDDMSVTLMASSPGRGIQKNAGAAAARGNLLFFLHADTRPDQTGMDGMLNAWRNRASSRFCGAFDLAIDSPKPWFRLIEKTASLRSRLTRIPYGDQGIFISRPLFDAIGGFPKVPLMEDVGMMAAVKRMGVRPLFLDQSILTSARRWETRGVFRATLRNWILISLYLMGVSAQRLAKFY